MRFIAKYAKYAVQIRPQIIEAYATGHTKVVQPQIVAQFSLNLVDGDERALARQMWSFNGFYQEEDMVSIVAPDYRISAFDSRLAQAENDWTDEERELVETVLSRTAERFPQDLIVIEEKRVAIPWPTYDTFPGEVDELLLKIEADGFALTDILAYEQENQNRPEVIAALEEAIDLDDIGDRMREQAEEELVG
jgi:hypothetical protein